MREKTTLFMVIAAMTMTVFSASAQSEMLFSYADPALPLKRIGFLTPTTYDAAIRMPADYRGSQITGVKIPVVEDARVGDYKIWISTALETEEGQDGKLFNKPNVCIQDAERNGAVIEADFAQAYTIPSEGDVYVGYSFTVTDTPNLETRYPVVIVNDKNEGSCFQRTVDGMSTTWMDYSVANNFTLAMGVKIRGNFADNMVDISELMPVYAPIGEPGYGNVKLINYGGAEIREVEYTYILNGQEGSGVSRLSNPIPAQFGATGILKIEYPPHQTTGTYNLEVTIKRIDGRDNAGENATARTYFNVVPYVPRHLPVFEEFTGTWCGWCPKGFAGIEALKEAMPESICISYHGGDPMTMKAGLPYDVPEFPYGYLDRVDIVDPYYGMSNKSLGIVDDYIARSETFTPADVKVQASWADGAKTQINIKSTVNFVAPGETGALYRIGYILVADGLEGEGNDWMQVNNYSQYLPVAGEPGLQEWVDKPLGVTGMVYNDVPVFVAGNRGIADSLPRQIAASTPMTHEYTINIADCLNMQDAQIIQDVDRLRVVAVVYKEQGGKVSQLNAAQCNVPGRSAGNITKAILFEEFTGTWCGNCTRGFAGIEFLKEHYPNVIVVSYHGGRDDEVMRMAAGHPSFVSSYPNAAINRNAIVDPYFGSKNSFDFPLGVEDDILAENETSPIATMWSSAQWEDDSQEKIVVNTNVNWLNSKLGDFRIGYILVADGLKGEGAEWVQTNTVSGLPTYMGMPYMDPYVNGPRMMADLEYNDVAIWSAGTNGITGSLPQSVMAGDLHTHSLTIDLAEAVNKAGMSLVQNKNRLRIVTFVVERGTGTVGSVILTAAQANIMAPGGNEPEKEDPEPDPNEGTEGVEEMNSESPATVFYYDLSGRQVATPTHGMYIRVNRYSNGKVETKKILMK